MGAAVVRLPDRAVVDGAIRLGDLVVHWPGSAASHHVDGVAELGDDDEDPVAALLLQLHVLALGHFLNPARAAPVETLLQALLPQLELLGAERMLGFVAAAA